MKSPDISPLLSDLGEDELVRRLTATLHLDPRQVSLGAGDDCAILPGPADPGATSLLFKTDALVEGVHFHWEMGAELVGRKAVCRVLSDFAAMGGQPQALLVTVGAPGNLRFALLEAAYAGINGAGREFGCSVAGGELTSTSGPSWFSIAAVGQAPSHAVARRSGGRAGDLLFVTGALGGSFESGRHLNFTPRLAEGHWLVEHFPIEAMMDLSDGLGADLPRLAAASHCGYELHEDALPLHEGCSISQALNDGEDYELLFAIGAEHANLLEASWAARFPGVLLTRIGQLTPPGVSPDAAGHEPGGYHHFRRG